MIRGKYLRERKAIRFKRRIKLIVCMLILVILHKIIFSSYSLYESEANSNLNIDTAFFVLKNENLGHLITLDDLSPGDETSCSFSIANFKVVEYVDEETGNQIQKTVVAETDIKYKLTIRTTTNLPLEYKLYLNDNPLKNSTAVDQITDGGEINQDEYNTYFNKLIEYENTFSHDNPTTDTYILEVKFPKGKTSTSEEYMDYSYQNIIDAIEISIEAEQLVDDTTNP